MTGEEVARELIFVLYGIGSDQLLGAMRDRASVNNVAMATLKVVYPTILDVGCLSHTIYNMGRHFNTPTLRDFMTAWLNLISHSPKARLAWRSRTGRAMRRGGGVRGGSTNTGLCSFTGRRREWGRRGKFRARLGAGYAIQTLQRGGRAGGRRFRGSGITVCGGGACVGPLVPAALGLGGGGAASGPLGGGR